MRGLIVCGAAFFVLRSVLASPSTDSGQDWPQLACTPQRQGYTEACVSPPYKLAWECYLGDERIAGTVQPVVSGGRVFFGSKTGAMRALDAKTGNEIWRFETGWPIMHAAGVENKKVFFGGMDGAVYALDTESGRLAWKFQGSGTGFSTAVLLAEGKVFTGNRGGVFYAIDQVSGAAVWEADIGSPIFQSAAYNNGKVFFGAEDMRVYALDAASGEKSWQTKVLPGMTMGRYFPVAYRDVVIVLPCPYSKAAYEQGLGRLAPPFTWWGGGYEKYLAEYKSELEAGLLTSESIMRAQQKIVDFYIERPWLKVMFFLDEKTGEEAFVAPHTYTGAQSGPMPPPCVDSNGLLMMPVFFSRATIGRFDADARRIIDIPWDWELAPRWDEASKSQKPAPRLLGQGNCDETLCLTAGGDIIYVAHQQLGDAFAPGVFDVATRKWDYFVSDFVVARRKETLDGRPVYTSRYQSFEASGAAIAQNAVFINVYDCVGAFVTRDSKSE